MTGTSSKRKLRIENKHKKMAALLNISKLNEYDRAQKKIQMAKVEAASELDSNKTSAEPSPKRQKTDEEEIKEAEIEPPPLLGNGPTGKPLLQGTEFAELKKMLREKSNKIKNHPLFRLRDMGELASVKVDLENRIPLFLSDLQHLIMYSQIGVHSPYSPARWCVLDKYNRLKHMNILIVENVSLYHFTAHESLFPFLSSTFETKLELLPTNCDIVKDLSLVPITATQMRKFRDKFGTLEAAVTQTAELFDSVKQYFPIDSSKLTDTSKGALPSTDIFPRTQLLLSGWQMVEENYPLPIKGLMERKYPNYVLTKQKYQDVTPNSPMFGIDCEMCRTSIGDLELTRVSVVNEKLEVFYDTLVKPDNKIVDYLTRFSGINAKMMKGINKKLSEVQQEISELLPDDAILVGQSLGNDLHALKMMHPYVIDTSVIYNITGDRMRKTKLQTLAREFLSEKIQESKKGHCSTEDSLACMKLAKLKLTKSLYFGDAVMGGMNESRSYPDKANVNFATSLLQQCTKIDKTARVLGVDDLAGKYKFYVNKGIEEKDFKNIKCEAEKSNKEVIRKFCEDMDKYSLNIGHIRVPDNQLDGNNKKAFKNLDKYVKEIYEKTTAPSLVVVVLTGQKEGGNGVCCIQLKREVI